MRSSSVLAVLVLAGFLHAQDGQRGSRAEWPCVPGRAVDPAYLDTSESTGGQLFLFQKSEVAHASLVMSAPYTHSSTILRAVGQINGSRDFEFPVDSSTESILVLASLQCRNAILVTRPNGSELTAANSAQSIDLQAGRILRVDLPEPGKWRVRLAGKGLFVVSVLANSGISLAGVSFSSDAEPPAPLKDPLFGIKQKLEAHLSGQIAQAAFQVVDAAGSRIADLDSGDAASGGTYRLAITPSIERFRIVVTGTDSRAWPFQRTYPVLFRARPE